MPIAAAFLVASPVHWLRCVLAEWQLVLARLGRSRLRIWLLLLGAWCAWLAVARGGNASAGALLVYLAVPSIVSADALRVAHEPDAVTRIGIAILDFLPGVWRYDALATGAPGGWAHAAAWAAGGVVLAARLLARRAR